MWSKNIYNLICPNSSDRTNLNHIHWVLVTYSLTELDFPNLKLKSDSYSMTAMIGSCNVDYSYDKQI